ncbi:Uncharacterized protein APZ42_004209, partial [Daphnia magna]
MGFTRGSDLGGARALNKESLHLADAFDRHRAARLQRKVLVQLLGGGGRHMHPAGRARRLHAAGHVDGVAPQVVGEFVHADHTRDHRATVDADADLQAGAMLLVEGIDGLEHGKRHVHHRIGVVHPRLGQATDQHVAVADGFDFFHPRVASDGVEGRKNLIE